MKYLCFDIESCDGGKNGSLCSFGYCIADENFNILEQDDIIVNPKKPFNKRLFGTVIKLAYTEEIFRSAPHFNKVYDRIRALFDSDMTVLGFSIINDVNYLTDAIRTYKLPEIYYKFFDVQLMYGIHKKEMRNFSLLNAATEFGIEFLEHRSVDDAVATLKVLQGILDAENLSFTEFIKRYDITAGEISSKNIRNCFTDLMYVDVDYDNVRIKKKLLNEFLLSMPHTKLQGLPFSHKVVCFDEDIELRNIDYSRSLISRLYELGGRYSSGVESCNFFVYNSEDSARYHYAKASARSGHNMKFCLLSDFIEKIGDFPPLNFDDVAILSNVNKRRRLNRERACEKNKLIQRKLRPIRKKYGKPKKRQHLSSTQKKLDNKL